MNAAGLRYYLPAVMTLATDANWRSTTETARRAYWSLSQLVSPRDAGKGFGERFDAAAFAARLDLTPAQIDAIYRFACFMAVAADEGVDEDQLPALRKWRALAATALAQKPRG